MKKKIIRLTEGDLHRMIMEAVYGYLDSMDDGEEPEEWDDFPNGYDPDVAEPYYSPEEESPEYFGRDDDELSDHDLVG